MAELAYIRTWKSTNTTGTVYSHMLQVLLPNTLTIRIERTATYKSAVSETTPVHEVIGEMFRGDMVEILVKSNVLFIHTKCNLFRADVDKAFDLLEFCKAISYRRAVVK